MITLDAQEAGQEGILSELLRSNCENLCGVLLLLYRLNMDASSRWRRGLGSGSSGDLIRY